VLVADRNDNMVSILLGVGDGMLMDDDPFPVGDGPFSLAVADFNLDDRLDLATGHLFSGNVVVLFNETPPPKILGDIDGDGVVGASDLLLLLANWGLCGDCNDCPADLDGNCSVSAADLLILLSNWG